MIINRFGTWTARVGISLPVLAASWLVAAIECSPARAVDGLVGWASPTDPRLASVGGARPTRLFAMIDPPRAQATSSERAAAPVQETSKASDAPVRAYGPPAPTTATLHTATLAVLDDETGRPLADVEVRIQNDVDWGTHVFQTNAGGQLRFEHPFLHAEPTISFEVRRDGYVPLGQGWGYNGRPTRPETVTFRLRRGITMGGIVVSEAGRPVEGATVRMTVTRYGPNARPVNPTGNEYYNDVPSRTGPDGRWRTHSVPPNAAEVELRLIHPDFVTDGYSSLRWPRRSPPIASLRDQSDRQVFSAGLTVEGRVVDEQGRPIVGARIHDSTRSSRGLDDDLCRPTDAEGRFRMHLPRGQKSLLTVDAKGHPAATQEVVAQPDRPAVEFRLPAAKRLRARVVAPDGRPIEGAEVVLLTLSRSNLLPFHTYADAQGRFEWDRASSSAVSVLIKAQGYVGDGPTELAPRENEVMLTLRPAVDVRFDAIDAQTGELIPRFRVEIGVRDPRTNGYHWGLRSGRSAPNKFELVLDAEKGPYHFRVSADDYKPVRILVPSTRTVLRKTFKLEKATK
jgi:hypothetical protein